MLTRTHAWSPEGFDRYQQLFPATPSIRIDDTLDKSELFRMYWSHGMGGVISNIEQLASDTSVLFVRGYLGNYMPGNLVRPVSLLRRLGVDSFILKTRSGDCVRNNIALLADQLNERRTRSRLVFCAHSKGAMECLQLLAKHAGLASRCVGVISSQMPSGSSAVMESILYKMYRNERYTSYRRSVEAMQRVMLSLLRAQSGGRDLTFLKWPGLVEDVAKIDWPFTVLQVASWSIRPTAWLDSFHARLEEISPGHAHDGQFYLEDLVWPGLPHVLLPEIDHAQPAMGGSGFDCGRYWLTLLSVLMDMIDTRKAVS